MATPRPRRRVNDERKAQKKPGFLEQILDFKVQWKLFWRLNGDPNVSLMLKVAFWFLTAAWVFIGLPIYIFLPDLVPGWIDDLLVAPWIVPYLLSQLFVYLCPDWRVKYHRAYIELEAMGPSPEAVPPSARPNGDFKRVAEDEVVEPGVTVDANEWFGWIILVDPKGTAQWTRVRHTPDEYRSKSSKVQNGGS